MISYWYEKIVRSKFPPDQNCLWISLDDGGLRYFDGEWKPVETAKSKWDLDPGNEETESEETDGTNEPVEPENPEATEPEEPEETDETGETTENETSEETEETN